MGSIEDRLAITTIRNMLENIKAGLHTNHHWCFLGFLMNLWVGENRILVLIL